MSRSAAAAEGKTQSWILTTVMHGAISIGFTDPVHDKADREKWGSTIEGRN
jgi:hypothetical protein